MDGVPSHGKLSVAQETITVIAELNGCHLLGGVRLAGWVAVVVVVEVEVEVSCRGNSLIVKLCF